MAHEISITSDETAEAAFTRMKQTQTLLLAPCAWWAITCPSQVGMHLAIPVSGAGVAEVQAGREYPPRASAGNY